MSTLYDRILTIHKSKASSALQKLSDSFLNGEIAYSSDALYSVTKELINLYNTFKEPTLTPIPLRTSYLPKTSAITTPLNQLDEDLTLYFEQLYNVAEAAKETVNICATERAGISELYNEAYSSCVEVTSYSSDSDTSFLWITDTFKTSSKIDTSASTTRIDTSKGIVSLAIDGETSLSSMVSSIDLTHAISGDTYAVGLPGNSLEISSIGYSSNADEIEEPSSPTFVGANQTDATSITNIFDEDSTTWFEWESYYVPKRQTVKKQGTAYVLDDSGSSTLIIGDDSVTRNYGWKYTITWPDGDESTQHWIVTPWSGTDTPAAEQSLDMILTVQFTSAQDMSWIELTPYLPTDREGNVMTCTLASVQVYVDSESTWHELLTTSIILNANLAQALDTTSSGLPVKDYMGTAVVTCPYSGITYVRVKLKQSAPYATKIGHLYYVKETQTTKTKKTLISSKTSTTTKWTRVSSSELEASSTDSSSVSLPIIGTLWGSSTTSTDLAVYSYYDIFSAYRYAMGIRELGLYERSYSSSGILVSKALTFSSPVIAVSIIVGETIPDGWDTSSTWVTYEISTDGSTWQTIVPQNTSSQEGTVIHFADAITTIYVRATLSRPDTLSSESPILNYYALKGILE